MKIVALSFVLLAAPACSGGGQRREASAPRPLVPHAAVVSDTALPPCPPRPATCSSDDGLSCFDEETDGCRDVPDATIFDMCVPAD